MQFVNGDDGIGAHERAIQAGIAGVIVHNHVVIAFDVDGIREDECFFFTGIGAQLAALAFLDVDFYAAARFADGCVGVASIGKTRLEVALKLHTIATVCYAQRQPGK